MVKIEATPMKIQLASNTREAIRPITAVSFCFLNILNKTTAVAIPTKATLQLSCFSHGDYFMSLGALIQNGMSTAGLSLARR